ncbi:sulfate ABC transporter permease [Vibrio sp. 99-70-13A1]|uniref:sulfate ABC transporter permease n=1 Tax=Vibrio sp. 99-70-13A1 TaxID=2607601 RepID=UPI001493DA35|nr:sulfate ABC transporter permease [Vibrio sp. 99-70-13A1]NOH98353.1 sulfate ABC transporter permease [Vibrio sp. 99-70-13A1]
MKIKSLLLLAFIPVTSFLPAISIAAIDVTDTFRISGFGTQSATVTDQKIPTFYQLNLDDEWCFDCDTTLGIQLDWEMSDHFRSSVQVVKAPSDEFSNPSLEWAYIAYRYGELNTKIGRLRVPLFMISEYYYVSEAYPWLRPPQDVYNSVLGFTYFDGAAIEWDTWINDEAHLRLLAFGAVPKETDYTVQGQNVVIKSRDTLGITAELNLDNTHFRASYLHANYKQDLVQSITGSQELELFTLGVNYLLGNINLMSEVVLSQNIHSNWYISANYLFDSWSPYITYSQRKKLRNNESVLVGAKYSLLPNVSTYVEWQHIWGREKPINGHFTVPQNPTQTIQSKVNIYSIGLSFTF